jgi:Fur family ferric uptake transcriptional regulator
MSTHAHPATLDLAATLERLGARMTAPRRRLAALMERWAGAFSPEELASALPDVGRATVYRTVKLLTEAGVLCRTGLPDGTPRYSVDQPHHHHHLVCVACGRVEPFDDPALERAVRDAGAGAGERLVGHRVELYYRCERCTRDAG